ncbi:MAG: DNA polymerase III subunit alpha [Candidatus Aminicenantes bacterium]|nr:DNA polymerase III subunit alpha [Candidatus Aminicenantes bacterium]
MSQNFIHLHNHSEFSILDGAVRIADLADAAFQNNMPAVALTDHGNIFGAVPFFKEAKKKGIKPILGCETYVAPKSRFDRQAGERDQIHFHLVLLVANEQGYTNLCRLLTKAYTEGFYYRPRIDKELLAQHSEGLIGLSGCLKGEVSFLLGKGLEEDAEAAAGIYADIFGKGRFYIELQDHGLPPQREVNPKLVRLARKLGLPLVATNDVHYYRKEDSESHDVLLCIQTNKKLSDQDRIRFGTTEFYFKSGEEMARLFHEVPEALENTVHIAGQCDFHFPTSDRFLPRFTPPEGMELKEYFERVVREGFHGRMQALTEKREGRPLAHPLEEYEERLEREIKLIERMGFEGYFLIVWDLIREARAQEIPVGPGRGSAAGSLLAYSLGITDIDPIEYDLLFERFLNPDRISLPDIDIDFCARRREEVIRYVTEKYGRDNVSQIITFGTMAARAAIRDVGRALEVPLPEVDRIAKMIPFGTDVTIEKAIASIPQLNELRDKNQKIAHLLSIAQKVEGQVRHPSTHAAGLVITPKPLTEFLPLYQSVKGEITTQFPMEDVEYIGLLKMDLLGLRNLTIIQDALDLIETDFGVRVDMKNLPIDDPPTFDLFKAGNTDGVFQFESRGMKELLRSYKPDEFRDLIALNALYRPGPLKSGMTAEFVKRKHHPDQVAYEIPELEPVLRETRGIIVYQEQVMRIATELAGFTLAEADMLRKAMGKKVAEIMKSQKENFLKGARKLGLISADKAKKLFENIKNFAEYGFNKSHSAAYAALAFQTAYLKAHYPYHFMAALMTSEAERGGTAQVQKYINECQQMGIAVLPPDINESDFNFTVAGNSVRYGLSAVKNVGETAARDIIKIRREHGKFATPFDVVAHVDSRAINRKVLESLIKAGAFDSLKWPRSQCFHLIDRMIDFSHEAQKAKATRQNLLFGGDHVEPPEVPTEVRSMREWDESLMLSYEKDALGFYITGHPLAQFKNLGRLVSHLVSDLDEEKDFNAEVRLAGVITMFRPLKTKKDERMAAFFLEDMSGRIEVIAFPDAFRKNYEFLHEDQLVWLKGKFVGEGESRKIQLTAVMPLAEAFQKLVKRMVIRVFVPGLEESLLDELKDVLEKHAGECPVVFELETPHAFRVIAQSAEVGGVLPSDELTRTVESLLGEEAVHVEY